MKKPSKKQIDKYFEWLDKEENYFWNKIMIIQHIMKKETGIKGIEFIWVDGSIIGIGTDDRKMKLIHRGM